MSPDKVFEKLKEDSTPKTRRTLDVIYQICREQEKRGDYDFSVSTIARLGIGRGIPKSQSLRNRAGEKYRALLKSFEQSKPSHSESPRLDGENDWIDEIDNPKLRLLARIQASDLAAANKLLRDFCPPGTRIDVHDYQNIPRQSDSSLNSSERRALEYLTSEDFLVKWNFTISEYGEIKDENGKVVLKPGTVDAVKKALAYL